jgi:hypothetical protein
MTQVEKDELLMETGKKYENLPVENYKSIPSRPSYSKYIKTIFDYIRCIFS